MFIYYLLLVVSIVFAVVKSSVFNQYAKSAAPGIPGIFKFNTVSYGIAAVITLCVMAISGADFHISWFSVLIAVLYAKSGLSCVRNRD